MFKNIGILLANKRFRLYSAVSVTIVIVPILIINNGTQLRTLGGQRLLRQFFGNASSESKTYSQKFSSRKGAKEVVLWTKFFGSEWQDHFESNGGRDLVLDMYRSCYFHRNLAEVDSADAVIFHGRDFRFGPGAVPSKHPPHQRWIFYLLESPEHTGFSAMDWLTFNQFGFNWSMTYSRLADVELPYGMIRKGQPIQPNSNEAIAMEKKISNYTRGFWERPRDAVWMVSNCMVPSRREDILKVLTQHGLIVDVWGGCSGIKPDNEIKRLGPQKFFSRYRFYLSFENSLCDDYVTEKGFQAFYMSYLAGTIPVVYGGADYSKKFQKGSYIDVNDFENLSDLAKLMKALSCPGATDLPNYWAWLRDLNPLYEIGKEIYPKTKMYNPDYLKGIGWRRLCEKLWNEDASVDRSISQVITKMEERLGLCRAPSPAVSAGSIQTISTQQLFHVYL